VHANDEVVGVIKMPFVAITVHASEQPEANVSSPPAGSWGDQVHVWQQAGNSVVLLPTTAIGVATLPPSWNLRMLTGRRLSCSRLCRTQRGSYHREWPLLTSCDFMYICFTRFIIVTIVL